jgi:hypothetical protein
MSALHAAAALVTAADVNVELAMNGPPRNLDLVLPIDVRLFDLATALRTSVGQRRLVDLVDLLGRLAVGLGAVVLAGFAARLFRLGLGRPLGERGRLAFAGAALIFEQPRQAFDPSTEVGDFTFEADTVRAWWFGHTFTVADGEFLSCASLQENAWISKRQTEALINYR